MGVFAEAKARAEKDIPLVTNSSELQRILHLPRRELKPDPILTRLISEYFGLENGEHDVLWQQAAALYEAAECNGLFGMLGCGLGKTLLTLLLPEAMESKSAVLLVPAKLRAKTHREIAEFYGEHWRLSLDILHIYSYHDLSNEEHQDLLVKHLPDLVMLDEAHEISRPTSARHKRLARHIKEEPGTRVVTLSGTFAGKKILEFAQFIEWCLGKGSPLPKGYHELVDWGGALDVNPDEPRRPGALRRFCEPGETVRAGFMRRLTETPGVVACQEAGFPGALNIEAIGLKLPKAVQSARKKVEKDWEIGDVIITEATHYGRLMKQLACGFHYTWKWVGGKEDKEWLEARREWMRELRYFLRNRSRAGLDAPKLVTNAVKKGTIDGDIQVAWREWSKVLHRPEPETIPVWHSDFMVKASLKWAKKIKKRAIIWYEHRAFVDAFRDAGLPVYAAGDDADLATEDVIVCSIKSQGTGKNLQYRYTHNLVTSWPSGGKVVEQMLSRTHRPKQTEDTVTAYWFNHTHEMTRAFESSLRDAHFQGEAMGGQPKMLIANML